MKQLSAEKKQRCQEFGILLRRLRQERSLTCEALAGKAGKISRSTLASFERGVRQTGAKISQRLADALELTGKTRDAFLLASLRTTTSEFLPEEAAGLDPQFFMQVWKMVAGGRLKPSDIKRIYPERRLTIESQQAVKDAALKLAEKAANLSQRIHRALASPDSSFILDLEVETRDGQIVLVEMLSGRSK